MVTERLSTEKPQLASDILREILERFPEIGSISYVFYDVTKDSFSDQQEEIDVPQLQYMPSNEVSRETLAQLNVTVLPLLVTISEFGSRDSSKFVLGITSTVILKDGSQRYIPMMDVVNDEFIGEGEEEVHEQEQLVEKLRPYKGFLLKSGNSYHFWGQELLTQREWEKFLEHCQKQYCLKGKLGFDTKWIHACRARGFCVLRIFAHPPYKSTEPFLVREIS